MSCGHRIEPASSGIFRNEVGYGTKNAVEADLRLVREVIDKAPGAYERLRDQVSGSIGASLNSIAAYSPWIRNYEADLRQNFELMLVQDDFKILRSYEGRSKLTTWIYTVASRHFRRRASHLRNRKNMEAGKLSENTPSATDIEAEQIRLEERAQLGVLVEELESDDRLLLKLFYEQSLSATTVAKHLGITASGARMRKARLLERLSKLMKKRMRT